MLDRVYNESASARDMAYVLSFTFHLEARVCTLDKPSFSAQSTKHIDGLNLVYVIAMLLPVCNGMWTIYTLDCM